jgi:hypothetical protein
MMASSWYVEKRGRQLGPFTGTQLKELAATGRLEPGDLVRRADSSKTVPTGEVRGLFPEPDPGPVPGGPPPPPSVEADGPPPLPTGGGRRDGLGEGWKGLTQASRAAAGLAAAKARKLRLERVVLPAAYGALGLDIHASGRFRDEFPELHAGIEEADRRVEQATPARPLYGRAKGLADRAAEAASGARATAQAKALSMKKESLLRRLGEAAHGRHGEASGPEHLVRPIVEALSAIESLDDEMGRLAGVGRGTWITPHRVLGASAVVGIALLALAARRPGDEAASRLGPPQEAIETSTSTSAAAPARAHNGSRWVPAPAGDDSTAAFFRAYPDSATSGEFVGKRLVVSGGRVSLAELDGGVAQLHLQTTFRGVSALCKFPPAEAKAAWSWKAPTYTVEGTFEGSPRDGFVELADCRLVAGAGSPPHDGDATLPSIEQFLSMIARAGEVKNPRKGLPILVAGRYELRAALGEPTNVLSSERDRKGTHEVLDYACSDGRVLLSVTYDMAGAWIKEVAPQRSR